MAMGILHAINTGGYPPIAELCPLTDIYFTTCIRDGPAYSINFFLKYLS